MGTCAKDTTPAKDSACSNSMLCCPGGPPPGYPHPLVTLGRFALFTEHLDAGFIRLQVGRAVLCSAVQLE